jgi:hypothetical protein
MLHLARSEIHSDEPFHDNDHHPSHNRDRRSCIHAYRGYNYVLSDSPACEVHYN